MKKIAVICLILLAACMTATAVFAYADFTFVNQSLIRYDEKGGYFFAKIVNTGTTGAYIDDGNLKIYDAAGNVIIEEKYVSTLPYSRWLEPGDYVYAREWIYDAALQNAADFEFYVGQDNYGYRYTELPCEADLHFTSGSTDNYITLTFTNTTGQKAAGIYMTVAAYDSSDNLIFVDSQTMSELIVHPGTTISVNFDFGYSLDKYYNSKGMYPVRVEPAVYVRN